MFSVKPLRSTGITLLLRYYGLLRPPPETTDRYVFRFRLFPSGGSPRFLGCSFDTRRPLSPRRAGRLLALVSSSSVLVSPPSAGGCRACRDIDRSQLCNEADLGSLALRLASLSHEASPRRITPPCARLTTYVTSNSYGELLSVH